MGARIRAFAWESSPLGPISSWSQSLKSTVELMMASQLAMNLVWGSERIQFYNDACIPMVETERHPAALGGRGRDFCGENWDFVGSQIDYVMAGNGSIWEEDRLVPVTRGGRRENAHQLSEG